MELINTAQPNDNIILAEKALHKKPKKKLGSAKKDQQAFIKKYVNDLQKPQSNKVKLKVFRTQLTCLIDALPDTVLLKDREGRKSITDKLTKRLFKQHNIDWYSKSNITLTLTHQEILTNYEHGQLLVTDLALALAKRQLKLYYQIQVGSNRQILGAEAQLRWEHPRYGLIVPDQFNSIAEQAELIQPIGAWVLKTACKQLKLWQNDPFKKNLSIAVNINFLQFSQPKFSEQLSKMLDKNGIDATRLKLELTGSLKPHDLSRAIEKMKALKLLGIQFSLDNFGIGYSSLAQLKKLPIDQLKIDDSLIQDIVTDSGAAMIVKTIIEMSHKLGIDAIADGVESEEQFVCLKNLGCLSFQGYLFGKPLPISEFEKTISLWSDNSLLIEPPV